MISTNNMNTNNTTGNAGGAGSRIKQVIKGAIEVVHGAGENIRGTALGVVDTMGHSGETKNDEIARAGRLEMQRGVDNLKGRTSVDATGHTGVGTTATSGTSYPAKTGTDGGLGSTTTGATGTGIGAHAAGAGKAHQAGFINDQQGVAGMGANTGYGQNEASGFNAGQQGLGTTTRHGEGHNVGGFTEGEQYHGTSDMGHSGIAAPEPNANFDGHHTPQQLQGQGLSSNEGYPSHHRDDAVAGVPQNELHEVEYAGHENAHSQRYGSGYPRTGSGNAELNMGNVEQNMGDAPAYNQGRKSPMSAEAVAGGPGGYHLGNGPVQQN